MNKIKYLGVVTKGKVRKSRSIYECPLCGNEFEAFDTTIKSNSQKSCGCLKSKTNKKNFTKHGMRGHRLYKTWNNMISRCNNPNVKDYKWYGKRGISVCKRWHDVSNFISDMEPTYKDGLTIDRINVDGNYSPDNCRWLSMKEQQWNTRLLRSSNTSGQRGVSLCSNHNQAAKWRSRIYDNGKEVVIGYYKTSKEAGVAYDNYCISNNITRPLNKFKELKNEC